MMRTKNFTRATWYARATRDDGIIDNENEGNSLLAR